MPGKITTLILTVDLDCRICSKKIKKALCKLQDGENIQTISYDEKNNTVTISGPFDPNQMKKKLCCKACRVIKDIKVKEEEKKQPVPPQVKPPVQPQVKPSVEPPKEKVLVPVYLPVWPVGLTMPVCCGRPCNVGYYGGCRCCTCGCTTAAPAPPLPPKCHCEPSSYEFFCEEYPSPCSIM